MSLLGNVLTMLFATVVFSMLYKQFNLLDPKDLIFLFSTSMILGWILMKALTYMIVRKHKG